MYATKKLKMKKVKNILSSREEVQKVRQSLEKKTEKAYSEFAQSKQKVRELAHLKYLD